MDGGGGLGRLGGGAGSLATGVHSIALALYGGDGTVLAPPAVVSFSIPHDAVARERAGGGGGGGCRKAQVRGGERIGGEAHVGLGAGGGDQEAGEGKGGVWEEAELESALAEYAQVHAQSRLSQQWCVGVPGDEERWRQGECLRALIYTCPRQHGGENFPQVASAPCGGLADRFKGILSLMQLALVTKRSFFIDMKMPLPLETVLRPYGIDWRMEGVGLFDHALHAPPPDFDPLVQKSGLFSDYHLMTTEAEAICSFTADLLFLERAHAGAQPAVRVMCNLALHAVMNHCAPYAGRARGLGLMHVFPSPSHRLFAFLFRLHPVFEHFAVGEISARAEADHALLHWLPFIFALGEDSGGFGGGGGGGRDAGGELELRVFTVQLRFGGHAGYSQTWVDPLITQPWQLPVAADCLRQAMDEVLLPHQRTFGPGAVEAEAPWRVLVVADHPAVRGDFIRLASQQLRLPPEVFVDLVPDSVVHLDRDSPAVAAAGMPWALLEFLLASRSHSVIVTSGFGAAAGDIGGMTPRRVRGVRQGLHCAALPPTPWFAPPGIP